MHGNKDIITVSDHLDGYKVVFFVKYISAVLQAAMVSEKNTF